ncbi:EAL domain-containing protein [Alkalihalobacterium bogoriense]|uniref:EAL domain-containing protein n=1 Tax=Alkalihalobacterium bogoriense TaxID=246272 RepID=UPI000556EB3A|nr:EAL domain-containing protein [Alkalihalobacterium bogoriense]
MTSCDYCTQLPDIEEKGRLFLYYKGEESIAIENQLKIMNREFSVDNSIFCIDYQSIEDVLTFLTQMHELLPMQEQSKIYGTWSNKTNRRFSKMVSFSELLTRINHIDFVTVINHRLFTQHLQPIISLENDEIYGYEFLLRQTNDDFPFQPGKLFSFSQQAGLQSMLDSQARISSIEISSSLLETGQKRFINFLPSSIYDPNHCLKSTFKAVEQFHVDPSDLVFEVVETEKIENIAHLKTIFQVYQAHGIHVALDDLGSGYATVEVLQELKPDFAKIDRHLIDHCDEDKNKQGKIKQIIEIASAYDITLLAEGIERKEELEYCKDVGISLAQGFYIGKPNPKPIKELFL